MQWNKKEIKALPPLKIDILQQILTVHIYKHYYNNITAENMKYMKILIVLNFLFTDAVFTQQINRYLHYLLINISETWAARLTPTWATHF